MQYKLALTLSIGALGAALATSASANLLVYEGFNYALANGDSLADVAATGTGLQGNWSVQKNGGADSTYLASGLNFANHLPTSAGALVSNAPGGVGTSNTNAGVALGNGIAVTGPLYTSYLFQVESLGSVVNNQSALRVNSSIGAGANTSWFAMAAETSQANSNIGAPGVGYGTNVQGAVVPSSTVALPISTTYLAVARYDRVGQALAPSPNSGTATLWIFDQTGYAAWIDGGSLETSLGTHAIRVVNGPFAPSSGQFDFNTGKFIQLFTNAGSSTTDQRVIFDEIRYGTVLGDVVAVPEPASLALLGLSALCLVGRRRQA